MNTQAFVLVCVLLPCISSAADLLVPSDQPSESVVVTATRIPTPEAQIASSVTVITADDIADHQIRTFSDLLRNVPGLNVVQTGGPGGQTSVFMRGTNSNHTKVLIDGIDVADPSSANSSIDFGRLLTQDIQQVEVLRGPQSGLYGSDAIGGVINIITKNGSGPTKLAAALEAGSFNTFNQSASVSGSSSQFHYAATIDHLHAGSTPVTPSDYLPPGQQRINDYDNNLTGSTKLGFDVTDDFNLGLVARYTDTHLRFTGDNFFNFPSTPDTTQSEFDTRQYYMRATAHLTSFDGQLSQTIGAAYSSIKSHDLSADFGPTDNDGARSKFDWQSIVALTSGEKLLLGAEHQRDAITVPISASTTINSGYLELQSSLRDRVFDTLALRFDHNDRFGSKVTYRVAPAYLIADTGTKLKASLGSGFKAPTLSEMFQSFPAFGFFANPNLKAESSIGWDVGAEQAIANDQFRLGITYFHNAIRNLIESDFTTYMNVGRATTKGVESFAEYRPLKSLQLRLDYTYTNATDETTQLELLRRPKHKVNLNAAWRAMDRLTLSATLFTVGSWVDVNRDGSIPRLRAPGYTTMDSAAAYEFTSNWAVTFRVNNLLNRHYQNPDAFDQPTIGAYAGIKATF